MSESGCKQYSWFKSWLVTTLFCIAISVTTQSIWGGSLFTNAMISFGFGPGGFHKVNIFKIC